MHYITLLNNGSYNRLFITNTCIEIFVTATPIFDKIKHAIKRMWFENNLVLFLCLSHGCHYRNIYGSIS